MEATMVTQCLEIINELMNIEIKTRKWLWWQRSMLWGVVIGCWFGPNEQTDNLLSFLNKNLDIVNIVRRSGPTHNNDLSFLIIFFNEQGQMFGI